MLLIIPLPHKKKKKKTISGYATDLTTFTLIGSRDLFRFNVRQNPTKTFFSPSRTRHVRPLNRSSRVLIILQRPPWGGNISVTLIDFLWFTRVRYEIIFVANKVSLIIRNGLSTNAVLDKYIYYHEVRYSIRCSVGNAIIIILSVLIILFIGSVSCAKIYGADCDQCS